MHQEYTILPIKDVCVCVCRGGGEGYNSWESYFWMKHKLVIQILCNIFDHFFEP